MRTPFTALTDYILSLSRTERVRFVTNLLLELSEAERFAVLKQVSRSLSKHEKRKLVPLLTAPSRLKKLDRWLEGLLAGNPNLTPKRAAFMAINYFRYNRRMLPFLIAYARRVKARLGMRKRRTAGQGLTDRPD